MERIVAAAALVLLLLSCALSARAESSDVISTHCREEEIELDGVHTAARLGGCGQQYPQDLLWHLDRIDQIAGTLDGTFDRRNRGAGSVVYVMDTGVMATHNEFSGRRGSRVIAGFDVSRSVNVGSSACESDNKATDPCFSDYSELAAASHGTAVASLIAGLNIGVAPEAKLVSIRVMNERGLATTRTYLEGLDAIITHAWSDDAPRFRTAVVNISGWMLERLANLSSDPGFVIPYSAVEKRIRQMVNGVDAAGHPHPDGKRFLFVVAGNNVDGGCGRGGYVDRFPAVLGKEIDGLVTVGGMTSDNESWAGACRGGVEVLAPAQGVFSASITAADHYRGRKAHLRSGTSFAAPVIAGIAARLIAERPGISPQQLEQVITSTPSRVERPDRRHADGKVGYIRPSPRAIASQARADE